MFDDSKAIMSVHGSIETELCGFLLVSFTGQ